MAYIIHGPVPTQAIGKCAWCDKKNEILHLMAVNLEGKLCGEYICAKCICQLDEMKKQTAEKNGKLVLRNNPEVEIAEDEID